MLDGRTLHDPAHGRAAAAAELDGRPRPRGRGLHGLRQARDQDLPAGEGHGRCLLRMGNEGVRQDFES